MKSPFRETFRNYGCKPATQYVAHEGSGEAERERLYIMPHMHLYCGTVFHDLFRDSCPVPVSCLLPLVCKATPLEKVSANVCSL